MGKVKDALIFYFSFKGRATRYDFGVRLIIFYILASILASYLDFQIGSYIRKLIYPVSTTLNIFAFIAALAVSAKRLHDLNLSGWWPSIISVLVVTIYLNPFRSPLYLSILWFLTPLILLLFILFSLLKRGTIGPNRYGPDPLGKEEVGSV